MKRKIIISIQREVEFESLGSEKHDQKAYEWYMEFYKKHGEFMNKAECWLSRTSSIYNWTETTKNEIESKLL